MTVGELQLDPKRAGAVLRRYRSRRGATLQDLAADAAALRDGALNSLLQVDPESSHQLLRARLIALESGTLQDPITLADLLPAARLYGVSPLMFQSLAVALDQGSRLIQRLDEDFQVFRPGIPDFGAGCSYRVPMRTLGNSSAEFVLLKFDGGSDCASCTHHHPGEELALVLDGAVDYVFDNSGAIVSLDTGDLIHFASEQPHSARPRAVGHTHDPSGRPPRAELLIVRLHQVDDRSTRARITEATERVHAALRRRGGKLGPDERKDFLEWVDPAFRHQGPARSGRVGALFPQNSAGLGRWLQYHARSMHLSHADLAASAKENQMLDVPASLFERLELGDLLPIDLATLDPESRTGRDDRRVTKRVLDTLAAIYGVEPILLRGFEFPAIDDLVVLRPRELRRASSANGSCAVPPGAHYDLPPRMLARSDESLVFVTLERGATSPWNQHPGDEFIYCLSGAIEVRFEHKPNCPLEPRQYAHFRSSDRHAVANMGTGESRFFAIRFHETLRP